MAWGALPAGACLAIPSRLARRCGLRSGDMVLLAALPGQDARAAYPMAVVDCALRAEAPFPDTQEPSHDNVTTVASRRTAAGAVITGRQNTASSSATGAEPPAVTA